MYGITNICLDMGYLWVLYDTVVELKCGSSYATLTLILLAWVKLYIERWLKASVQLPDGSLVKKK